MAHLIHDPRLLVREVGLQPESRLLHALQHHIEDSFQLQEGCCRHACGVFIKSECLHSDQFMRQIFTVEDAGF